MNYMLDIETLSTHPQAAITQVGVAIFDHNEILKSHLWVIQDPVGQVDMDTVKWWFKQVSNGVPDPWTHIGIAISNIKDVLLDLNSRMKDIKTVWANSPTFDLTILDFAYKASGIECPWTFRQQRDVRTLASLFPEVERVKPEIKHNAESDARAQAQWVLNMLAELKR